MKKILVCDRYTQESLSHLKANLDCEIIKSQGRVPRQDEVHDIDVMLVRSRSFIDSSILDVAEKLELIISATSGFDHLDLKECQEHKVNVMHTPEANIHGAAQLTLLLTLALQRNLLVSHEAVTEHMWKEELSIGEELFGKQVGLVGLGRVGKKVAELCNAFGCEVSAHDPYVPDSEFKKLNINALGLTELLRQSDVISLHTPLTKETENMINRKTLELMSENSLLINIARGKLIDENDLVEALENKQIAGAALDVFQKEPLPRDSRLLKMKNVIFTPHIGAYTKESFSRASMEAAEKVVDYFKNNTLSDELPPKVDWFEKYGW